MQTSTIIPADDLQHQKKLAVDEKHHLYGFQVFAGRCKVLHCGSCGGGGVGGARP
jgi:hypothetical protein